MGPRRVSLAVTQGVRTVALVLSIGIGLSAGALFLQYGSGDGLQATDWIRSALIILSTFWLAWGAIQGLIGLGFLRTVTEQPGWMRGEGPAVQGTTAILVPVYNEEPMPVLARVAAMDASLAALGVQDKFHFAVLSDTRKEDVAAQEREWFLHLVRERGAEGRMFYRRRASNPGKKAGNIEDFFQRSGGAYDYALILDADSLMEGATILEMARRVEADPQLGLLQSLPKVIEAESRFGRAMQFSASFFSPAFARGLGVMQGRTGPFWGHNAMVRVKAFVESCGLPVLAGDPPFGGHIMSHDYVEASLLARAGWTVRLDEDLEGSFEEGPENIVDHAKRDRRWCQGNLQHSRLVMAPGLKPWSRFVFVQGILAYIAPLFWLGFMATSIAAILLAPRPDYFPDPYGQLFPFFPHNDAAKAIELAIGIFGLLLLPKLMIGLQAAWSGRAHGFGGGSTAIRSTIVELMFSSVIAPVMLMFQTRSVMQVLLGLDSGWPTNNRGDGTLGMQEAWAASRWIAFTGLIGLVLVWWLTPPLVAWLLPVGLPMLFAPQIISWSSRKSGEAALGAHKLFTVPAELAPSPVILAWKHILEAWSAPEPEAVATEPAPAAGTLVHA
ncbi:glucans biosynthesis glucosyltransferase MdoH [Frigidibacter sp. MR17.24]|uniref:glucans biosynthesis glucosyltransferase MdoH n=1 Tax=Frigidibacter sp. MR17.24 TaxID=3127345 RepID=UPI003066BE24